MFQKFDEIMSQVYQAANGKKIILWGWGMSGKFIYMHLRQSNRNIECLIDDGRVVFADNFDVISHYALEYYEPTTTVILVSPFWDVENIKNICKEYGFFDVIVLRHMFFDDKLSRELDYYQWLEYEYGVDLLQGKPISEAEHGETRCNIADCHNFSAGRGILVERVLNDFIFDEDDAIFDFGCGKGASFFMFERAGIKRGAGIELDRKLYEQAKENIKKTSDKWKGTYSVICGDASQYTDIDSYNYFYMYDPFEGKCFKDVISNIEDSYRRKPRKIILIYMMPRSYKLVEESGMFHFSYEVKSVFTSVRIARIYVME